MPTKPAAETAAKKAPTKSKSAAKAKPAKTETITAGPAIGTSAPDFSMAATVVGKVSRASLKGKPYILYFYPKDDTSGCTAEACGFRDAMPTYKKLGITVIGVSKDDLKSHEKFAKKYDLTFPLAYDENGKTCEAFGTWVEKSMYGRKYMGIERSTYLIDAQGKIRGAWRKVSVPGHIEAVQKAIAEL